MAEAKIELLVHDSGDGSGGRHVARLPEGVRRRLGVLSGDTVIVEGANSIAVPVWPTSRSVSRTGVGLDEYLRARVGVSIGEMVRIHRERVTEAASVTVRAPGGLGGDDTETVHQALLDRPIRIGDTMPVDDIEVDVIDTDPDGLVTVTQATRVYVRVDSRETSTPIQQSETIHPITYEDIGGLDEELALVREAVELPLTESELFERLGIDPPTGILLYGPPGTGKTLIVEAIANSVDATLYHMSGPEITSKYKGESEERLREFFERARETAPAIVFFDEIDAIAGKRDTESDMENRVVAQLLSLMDGLEPRGAVSVIGATNRIDTLDPALRRPGRFDREIEIGVPDESGRRQIFGIHTEHVPIGEDVDLDRLATRTHGFVGADIRALVTEAAMIALRRYREQGHNERIEVTRSDFEAALASIDPSAMREFVAETPSTSFDEIGGLAEVKQTLREAVEWPLTYQNLFDATGTKPPTGILLYGPPGTGKTLIARAVANESDVNFIHVAGPELLDKYVGESEKAVRDVFERARQAAPTIIFFDEIDAIASRRTGDQGVSERVISQLLTELDGLTANPNLVVLAATNRKEMLEPALLRPGRLETHIEVPIPDQTERAEILEIHTRDIPLASDVDLSAINNDLAGLTGADIAAFVRDASMRAIREAVQEIGIDEANERATEIRVRESHFEAARQKIRDANG